MNSNKTLKVITELCQFIDAEKESYEVIYSQFGHKNEIMVKGIAFYMEDLKRFLKIAEKNNVCCLISTQETERITKLVMVFHN